MIVHFCWPILWLEPSSWNFSVCVWGGGACPQAPLDKSMLKHVLCITLRRIYLSLTSLSWSVLLILVTVLVSSLQTFLSGVALISIPPERAQFCSSDISAPLISVVHKFIPRIVDNLILRQFQLATVFEIYWQVMTGQLCLVGLSSGSINCLEHRRTHDMSSDVNKNKNIIPRF